MTDVTIPADVAKRIALVVRQARDVGLLKLGDDVDRWADLLDPKPPTLREKVYAAAGVAWINTDASEDVTVNIADAVLAVIADEWTPFADDHCWRDTRTPDGMYAIDTRVVGRWLRGEQS